MKHIESELRMRPRTERVLAESRGAEAAWARVPPPPAFALPFVLGLALNRAEPLRLVPAHLAPLAHYLGWSVGALATLLMVTAVGNFAVRRTTIIPHHRSTTLIVSGPYRLTRNPMYLGLTGVYLAAAIAVNTVWPLLLLSAPLWLLQTKTIPFEEAALERAFGAGYRAYRRRVRRWL